MTPDYVGFRTDCGGWMCYRMEASFFIVAPASAVPAMLLFHQDLHVHASRTPMVSNARRAEHTCATSLEYSVREPESWPHQDNN